MNTPVNWEVSTREKCGTAGIYIKSLSDITEAWLKAIVVKEFVQEKRNNRFKTHKNFQKHVL